MSADRLREAAKVLRERALEARAGAWFADGADIKAEWRSGPRDVALCDGSLPQGNEANAAYIAFVGPRVGLALADWLDFAGADLWAHGPALVVADLILGSES